MRARIAIFLAMAGVLAVAAPARAQDKEDVKDRNKVFKSLTPAEMEGILEGMGLEYKKVPAKSEGIVYFDFMRNKRNLRLHFFRGKDIMLDSLFGEQSLENVNRWNTQAKFTRACLYKDDKGPYTALEANLDLLGGVTENTIRHFFKTFEEEVTSFAKFTSGGSTPTPPATSGDDRVLSKVTPEKIEAILKKVNVTYKKQAAKAEGNFTYDYEANNFKIRLSNFGGKDLMLDAIFKKMPLDKLNQYNFNRKFIRAVLYQTGNQEYSALESNLDCTAGVSENMIQHFLATFPGEVQAFADFLGKSDRSD